MRTKPISSVMPVVMAIMGKLLISGLPMFNALASMSSPCDPEVSRITPGTVTASTSGGITIGPNRPRRRTAQTAITAPAM